MSRPRLPYLQRDYDRHGNARWYVRKDRGKRIRIKGDYGSPEFKAAYEVAVYGKSLKQKPKRLTKRDTLRWLIMEYRKSTDWQNSSPVTRRQKDYIFAQVINKADVNKSAHGVRKISATRAANAGATVAQLKALFGWTDSHMPSLYTQTADRRKLARDAIEKLTLNSEY